MKWELCLQVKSLLYTYLRGPDMYLFSEWGGALKWMASCDLIPLAHAALL